MFLGSLLVAGCGGGCSINDANDAAKQKGPTLAPAVDVQSASSRKNMEQRRLSPPVGEKPSEIPDSTKKEPHDGSDRQHSAVDNSTVARLREVNVEEVLRILRGHIWVSAAGFPTLEDAKAAHVPQVITDVTGHIRIEDLAQYLAKKPGVSKAKYLVLCYGVGAPLEKVKTILGKESGTEDGFADVPYSVAYSRSVTWHKYGWFQLGVVDGKLVTHVRLEIQDFIARPRR